MSGKTLSYQVHVKSRSIGPRDIADSKAGNDRMPALCIFAIAGSLWLGLGASWGQEKTTSVSLADQYRQLRAEYQNQLFGLAEKCRELNKEKLAAYTRRWVFDLDPARLYFHSMRSEWTVDSPDLKDATDRFWSGHLRRLQQAYAARLLVLAAAAVRNGDSVSEALAFRWVHEAVSVDPENRQAWAILGTQRQPQPNIETEIYRRRHPTYPNGDLRVYESDHFELYTSVDAPTALKAIEEFEQWFIVWRQCFYQYWASPGWMAKRMDPSAGNLTRLRKFKVVMFADRAEYLAKLSADNPGIEVSIGFYSFGDRTSYFYLGDEALRQTWVHELTHQWMHETIPVSSKVRIRNSIWAVEGVAMFMESLMSFGHYSTVGGEDAERLNFCRYHFFREGFHIPMQELNRMRQSEFVGHEAVKSIYSLSGSYAHFLMRNESVRGEFMTFLKLIHQGKTAARVFERMGDKIDWESDFRSFLKPTKAKLEPSLLRPNQYRILYLGFSNVDDGTIALLLRRADGPLERLETLDLSEAKISDEVANLIQKSPKLRYLSLERTPVGDRTTRAIVELKQLQSLDLTSTAVTDKGVARLSRLPRLDAIWLGGTQISDASVPALLNIPNLAQVDVRKTQVTDAGQSRLGERFRVIE